MVGVSYCRKPRPCGTGRSGPGRSALGLGDQVGVAPGGIPAFARVEGGAAIGGVLVAGDDRAGGDGRVAEVEGELLAVSVEGQDGGGSVSGMGALKMLKSRSSPPPSLFFASLMSA